MRIMDWDDAYANRDHVPGADQLLADLPGDAAAYRDRMVATGRATLDIAYGPGARERLDLFLPEGPPKGLMVFVHGGYWRAFDKSFWSHFAQGGVDAGWVVALPSYTLAPVERIAGITLEVARAITHVAGLVEGPIRLTGHSAGGHLVARTACIDTTLGADVTARIAHTVSISGVHDLRPLVATQMNADFGLTITSAAAESPALLMPRPGARLLAWVGDAERPEFVRQSTLLANIWTGLGADMAQAKDPGRNHFDVIDGLRDVNSPLMQAILS